MSKTLLLADDSVTIQRVVELTFSQEDVRVVSMSDGRRAMEWLDIEKPDIVLADVAVPEVDGYALARHVKQSKRHKGIPVLLMAGAFEPVDDDKARAIGCDGVIVKPFEPRHLVDRVKELIFPPQPEVAEEPAPPPASASSPVRPPAARVDVSGPRAGLAAPPQAPPVTPFPATPPPAEPAAAGPVAVTPPQPLGLPTRGFWEKDTDKDKEKDRDKGRDDEIDAEAAPAARARRKPAAQNVSLVNAFTALLAAEKTSAPAPVAPAAAAPAVSDAAIEQAVRRVLARMTDDLVRRIVLDTAERLIREEIEKIKANPE